MPRFCFVFAALLMTAGGCTREAPAPERLAVPQLPAGAIVLRVAYVENPRFERIRLSEVAFVLDVAREAAAAHFGREIRFEPTQTIGIERFFAALPAEVLTLNKPMIYDYAGGTGDRERLHEAFVRDLQRDRDDLVAMIEYAAPFLLEPVRQRTYQAFADALISTQLSRIRRLAAERSQTGLPMLDASPYAEYSSWDSIHYAAAPYEVIVTNQLIASVEYYSNSVHSAIRGGISNGLTTPNLTSRLQSTAIVSVQPMLGETPTLRELRGGETYTRRDALRYAGLLLAHEIGHLLFHVGHPWGRAACIMNPPPLLHFRTWAQRLSPADCPIEASGPMSPGFAVMYRPRAL